MFNRHVSSLLSLLFLFSTPSFAASETVSVTANVVAACSLTAPPTVNLGDIPASEFANVGAGEKLTAYAKSISIKSECYGTSEYELTFKATNKIINGCYSGDFSEDFGFCLKIDNVETTMKDEGITLTKTASQTETEVLISPQKPASKVPLSGSNTLTLNLTLSPH